MLHGRDESGGSWEESVQSFAIKYYIGCSFLIDALYQIEQILFSSFFAGNQIL